MPKICMAFAGQKILTDARIKIKKSELYSVDHITKSLNSVIEKTDTYSQEMPVGASSYFPQA